jgi:tetratricopeptide (TPR) repeat protein
MKNQRGRNSDLAGMSHWADDSCKLRSPFGSRIGPGLRCVLAVVVAFMSVSIPRTAAQQASPPHSVSVIIHGAVLDSHGKPVVDALVRLQQKGVSSALERKTNGEGAFTFSSLATGYYLLSAEKAEMHSHTVAVSVLSPGSQQPVKLILEGSGGDSRAVPAGSPASASPAPQAMEFADKPSFTVAGVTDWTAVGGHGSDSTLRTSESLTRETLALKPEEVGPGSTGESAVAVSETGLHSLANEHRLAGEQDEKRGDPLAAVHEFEQAARLDPNEQNYFEWGSELLLHRAVWQAVEVFEKGAAAYPQSGRMLTALGTALFAGARYDEAALRLCDASDLNPGDPEPYIFMGRIEMAAPSPLSCVEPKLARFVQQQPDNSLANYLYAMAIWKRQQQPLDQSAAQQVEKLLTKAVAIDAKCADAYLQLGILYSSQRNIEKAIAFYVKAIDANPKRAEAHYRLAVAYDRTGEHQKATQEFQLHDQIKKAEADAVERQRREIKQFLVDVPEQPAHP